MLQTIHSSSKRLLAWIVLPLISFTFVLFGIQSYLHLGVQDTVAAEVNGDEITSQQLRTTFERLRRQQNNNQVFSPEYDKQLKEVALQQLITNKVILDAAKKSGFYISDNHAESTLTKIPAFQEDGKFSPQLFQQLIANNMFTPKTFIESLKQDMIINQLQAGLVSSAFTTPHELQHAIELLEQKRDIDYLVIPTSIFNKDVKIDDQQLQAFYKAHQDDFRIPPQVKIEYIELSQKAIANNVVVKDQQAQMYYAENKDNYKTPKEWRVAQIVFRLPAKANKNAIKEAQATAQKAEEELAKGAKFADVVAKYSDDIMAKKNGGLLPWFTAGTLDPEFEAAVAQLSKKGDISAPTRTRYGISIIKLIDTKPSVQKTFAEVKPQILQQLKQDAIAKAFAKANEDLTNLTFSNPDTLEPAAKAINANIKASEFFTATGGTSEVTKNQKVINAAFSDDVLNQGNNSDVIQLNNDEVIVIRVKEHKPASIKDFASVKDEIKAKIVHSKAMDFAKTFAEEIMIKNEETKADSSLLQQHNLSWKKQNSLARHDKELNPVIVDTAFQLPAPTKLITKPTKFAKLDDDHVVIVKLEKIIPADMSKLTDDQRKVYMDQLAQTNGMMDYQLFVQSIRQNATIKRHKNN